MIDSSFFYLVYEIFIFLKSLPIWNKYTLFHIGGFLLVVIVLWTIIRWIENSNSNGERKNFFYFTKTITQSLSVMWLCFTIFVLQDKIAKIGNEITAFLNTDIGVMTFIILFFCNGLYFFFLHTHQSKEPTKNSTLNRRQISIIIFITSWLIVILYTISIVSFPFFKYLILSALIGAELISIFLIFYDPITFILSCFFKAKIKTNYKATPNQLNRYAIIICAHNEETVVSNLIHSLQSMTYPKEFFDIYTICDNCTDRTADVVRESGAIAMERFDEERRGKAFGLEWMFDLLEEKRIQGNVYDAYIVLDADNLVNAQFLEEINIELNKGYEILQAYLGSKNPQDTWVTKCYSLAYWISNLIYQNAHSRLGLSAQMGGTGMIVRPSVLEDIGWNTSSLTEDLLLTTLYVKETGSPCRWVHKACLYDEKPLKIDVSVRQRTRWMQGHMATFFQHGFSLLIEGIVGLSIRKIDLALYLARPFLILITFAIYVVRVTAVIIFPTSFVAVDFIMTAPIAFGTVFFYILIQLYALYKEGYIRYFLWIPLQWFYTYSWYLPTFRGILKHKELYWVSTEHKRSISVDEVNEGGLELET